MVGGGGMRPNTATSRSTAQLSCAFASTTLSITANFIINQQVRLCSHWSSFYITALSLVESFRVMKYFHSDATPALLCHKEPAQGTQSPLLGALGRSLVLYGIRISASMH